MKDQAEEMWKIAHQFIECQIDGPVLYGSKKQVFVEDSDLDEFKSHRILVLHLLLILELKLFEAYILFLLVTSTKHNAEPADKLLHFRKSWVKR